MKGIFKKKPQQKEEKESKNICPICGKPYEYALGVSVVEGRQICRHDSEVKGPTAKAKRRHFNEEASIIAMRKAAEQKAIDTQIGRNKMVPVTSYQEGKNKGKTMLIPEKTIKDIEEKVAPELEE